MKQQLMNLGIIEMYRMVKILKEIEEDKPEARIIVLKKIRALVDEMIE